MLIIMFIGCAIFSFRAPYDWSQWVTLIVPSYALIFYCLPAWLTPKTIDLEKLRNKLSENWENYEDLSVYMRKHWIALQYAPYSRKVSARLTLISIATAILAVYLFYAGERPLCYLLGIFAMPLFYGGICVNRPLASFEDLQSKFIATNPLLLKELSLSATALVAYAEMFPHVRMAQLIGKIVMDSDIGRYIIKLQRRKPIQVCNDLETELS